MNKEKNIFKIKGYDGFKCIADKCKFTCCIGWDINIDTKTYDKWNEEDEVKYLLGNVRFIKSQGENTYLINKKTKGTCPLLTNEGLCHIVINHGEDYLSSTCKNFPRIENKFDDIKELTLSCSCPEVVNIISNMKEKICIEFNEEFSYIEDLGCLKIRETLINMFQKEEINIENKLVFSYSILMKILYSDDLTYEDLIEFLEKCSYDNYIKQELNEYKYYKNEDNKYLKEINSLFIDIIENYRSVSIFEERLSDVYKFAKNINKENIINSWDEFKDLFKEYDNLIENVVVSKILSNCINEDLEEMIISLEIIILEYLFIRHALFLKYSINMKKEINIQDIKDYIVIFSRVIENNSDSVIEFVLDIFNSEILDLDYIGNLILS